MEEMSRASHVRLSRREILAAVLLFTLLCLLTPRALGAHMARLEPAELAAASAHVVVAVVEKGDVRWNEQRILLFTGDSLLVEDRLRCDAPGNLPAGTYDLAFYLRDPKDAYAANNGAWSNADVTLTVQ